MEKRSRPKKSANIGIRTTEDLKARAVGAALHQRQSVSRWIEDLIIRATAPTSQTIARAFCYIAVCNEGHDTDADGLERIVDARWKGYLEDADEILKRLGRRVDQPEGVQDG